MSPRTRRTFGQNVSRKLRLLTIGLVFAAIAITFIFYMFVYVIPPLLTSGFADASPTVSFTQPIN